MAYQSPLEKFSNELDELIEKYKAMPWDDRPSYAELIAALEFKKFNMMSNVREDYLEEPDDDDEDDEVSNE